METIPHPETRNILHNMVFKLNKVLKTFEFETGAKKGFCGCFLAAKKPRRG
jgi:hypothetical protein